MKKIEAIIKPHKLDEVKDGCAQIGVSGMTVYGGQGVRAHGGKTEVYRGSAYVVDFVPKVRIVVVVKDSMVARLVQAIMADGQDAARSATARFFVANVEEAIRIRTGERGDDAIEPASRTAFAQLGERRGADGGIQRRASGAAGRRARRGIRCGVRRRRGRGWRPARPLARFVCDRGERRAPARSGRRARRARC